MKQGILHRNTRIHTMSGMVLKIGKGTKVIASRGEITFKPIDGVKIFKVSGQYFLNLWESIHTIVLPQGGRAPYPLSLL